MKTKINITIDEECLKKINKKLDPTDREIIRVLAPLKLPVTPNKIATTINVHQATVQERLRKLDKFKITKCKKDGKNKRMVCEIDPMWKQNIKNLD